MVDENFNTWLIEVNSSPAMDYSTKVTTRLVKIVLKDTAKVIVDWKDAPRKVLLINIEKEKKPAPPLAKIYTSAANLKKHNYKLKR